MPAESPRSFQVDVGSRLTARDLLRRDGRPKELREAGDEQHCVDQLAVRRRCERKRIKLGEPPHCVDCAVDQRQVIAIGGEHAPHDLVVDCLRLVGNARPLVQIARPLGRAHAHQRALHVLVVAAAALADVRLAHLVPDLL
jgi:hypothetical protein